MQKIKHILLTGFLFLGCCFFAYGNKEIDSLKIVLEGTSGVKRAEILLELSGAHSIKSPQNCIEFCSQALKIAQDNNDPKLEANVYLKYGEAYQTQGNLEEALDCNLKALKIHDEIKLSTSGNKEEIENLIGIALVENNIGIIYKDLKNNEKALEYYGKALKTHQSLFKNENRTLEERKHSFTEMGIVLLNLGNVYLAMGDQKKQG